jgi:transposase
LSPITIAGNSDHDPLETVITMLWNERSRWPGIGDHDRPERAIKPTGRPPKLSDEQREALKQLIDAGPDPEKDGVVRWRCVDLKRVLGQRFGVDLSEVSLGRALKKLGFSHISARPRHPIQDPEAIAAFKKTFQRRSRRS